MKYGWLILLIGLIVGFVIGLYATNAFPVIQRGDAGLGFINGVGTGLGASVGLVLMIWLLKTCDRYLAAYSNTKAKKTESSQAQSSQAQGG